MTFKLHNTSQPKQMDVFSNEKLDGLHIKPKEVPLCDFTVRAWRGWEGSCCPPCSGCWENDGYYRRSDYLTEWCKKYILFEDRIKSGKYTMPRLMWYVNREADNLKSVNLIDLHDKRCKNQHCNRNCSIAFFMKEAWGEGWENKSETNPEQPLRRYLNLKRKGFLDLWRQKQDHKRALAWFTINQLGRTGQISKDIMTWLEGQFVFPLSSRRQIET